ncbi:LptF/LptG family permease [Shimia biformata]|uniref:LptF/LptG family permease n=1 Tax=Shimia biformata TaxID=1294299 RepID=UPI00194E812D|nr:LptF/LptG family permease [Shimia biformata]
MTPIGPVTRILLRPVLARLALILLLVEAVFLAESFTTLLEQALRYDGAVWDLGWLLVLKLPRILDLALALALLIALYFAVSEARARGELVILATAGIRWTRIVWFALSIGVVGGFVSLIVAGFVLPEARYSERITIAQLRTDYLTSQITRDGPRDTLHRLDGVTFIASAPDGLPENGPDTRGRLFFFQPQDPSNWRAGQSRDWTIKTGSADEVLVMKSLRLFQSPSRNQTGSFGPIHAFNVENAELAFSLASVVPAPNQSRSRAEKVLALSDADPRRLSGIAARALLVPFAALVALAAVALSAGDLSRLLALPAALLLVMVFDVAGRTLVTDAAARVPWLVLTPIVIAAYLGPPLAVILWRGETMMTPPRGRT